MVELAKRAKKIKGRLGEIEHAQKKKERRLGTAEQDKIIIIIMLLSCTLR